MSAEESTSGAPAERTDRPSDARTTRAPASGRPGSSAQDAASAEEATGELIALDFAVHKSIRYHTKRRAFFDVMHRIAMLVAVVGGSAAFFALIGNKTGVGQIAALVVAIATALDLVFALPENAREHDKLAERFSDLAVELALAQSSAVDDRRLAELKARRLAFEKGEPTALDALNVICHNEEAEARGYGRDQIYHVGLGQKIFAQLITFPWFHPTAEA
ncbi:MAG TPA: hypothetical protein VGM07_12815 [Stellaceae bacterium]|jgi:hypothetical protein